MIKLLHVTSILGLLVALVAYLIFPSENTSFEIQKTIHRPSKLIFDLLQDPESLLLTSHSIKKVFFHSILEDSDTTSKVHFSALEYFQHVGLQNITALLVADRRFNNVSISYLAFKGIVNIHSSYNIFSTGETSSLKVHCSLKVPWILKNFLHRRYLQNFNETLNVLEEVLT